MIYNDIYTKGVAPGKVKLWSVVLFLLILPALIFGGWMILNQGRIYISFKDIPNTDDDYQVMARIVDGPWFEDILFANVYSNAGNSFGLDKKLPIYSSYIDIDNDGEKEIVVKGHYYGPGTVTYILKKRNRQYEIIHNIHESGGDHEAFSSEQISFLDLDGDAQLKVVTDSFLSYKNAPDEVWTSYYRFDGEYYRFYKKDIVNFSEFKRLFVTGPDYYARPK